MILLVGDGPLDIPLLPLVHCACGASKAPPPTIRHRLHHRRGGHWPSAQRFACKLLGFPQEIDLFIAFAIVICFTNHTGGQWPPLRCALYELPYKPHLCRDRPPGRSAGNLPLRSNLSSGRCPHRPLQGVCFHHFGTSRTKMISDRPEAGPYKNLFKSFCGAKYINCQLSIVNCQLFIAPVER